MKKRFNLDIFVLSAVLGGLFGFLVGTIICIYSAGFVPLELP